METGGLRFKLGYWKMRGVVHPIRLMMEYAGASYVDVLYEQGEGPEFSRLSWTEARKELQQSNPLINLPYLIDTKQLSAPLSESRAILLYVARELDLHGSTVQERADADNVVFAAEGFVCFTFSFLSLSLLLLVHSFTLFLFLSLFLSLFLQIFALLLLVCAIPRTSRPVVPPLSPLSPSLLAPFEAWLAARSSSWLASARVSYADFFFYELMAQLLALSPRLRDLAPRSAALHDRVHELPALVRYRGSARFAAVAAFNNKSASFRG